MNVVGGCIYISRCSHAQGLGLGLALRRRLGFYDEISRIGSCKVSSSLQ